MADKYLLDESTKEKFITSNLYPNLNESEKNIMRTVLENQGNEVKMLMESTVTGDIAKFTPILVPVIRRALPSLIGTEIAGVQALKTPTAYLYAMVPHYVGDGNNSVSPTKNAIVLKLKTESGNKNDFNYTGTPIEVSFKTATTVKGKIVYSEKQAGTDDVVNVLLRLESNSTGSVAIGDEIDKAASFATKKATVEAVYTNEALWLKVLKNYTGPYATAAGEALGKDMKEMGISVQRVLAEAKTRKVKGTYTIEMLQDLKAQHGINAEKELADILSAEVALEIDRTIIEKANEVATVCTDFDVNSADGRWFIEKARGLSMRISNEAREIGRQTRKGGGNKLIVSPKVATILDEIGSFVLSPAGSKIDAINSGIKPNVGKFDNRYDVIVDNFAEFDYCTVAYKGASNFDAGIFFAPYNITLQQNLTDPVSGQPAMILNNRYDVVATPLHPEAFIRTFAVNLNSYIIS
ncbi:hypothetical protein [Campylobacter phage CP81]|uniref:Gp23 major capsid protein n=2 Tax=Fletchervirus TaxID=1636618 RepID=G8GIT3_9CAUD|nr:gp23 major capsid protein [Campylobacter phage CPX]YP_009623381.1 hypothetical protein FDJ37_gp160 [Campylobacter phage CP81]AET34318.1 gp23 major capsid protein [Campylobacter phage CPX]CBZ42322.1 hypothetical protein [Campylobacter phage CP81]